MAVAGRRLKWAASGPQARIPKATRRGSEAEGVGQAKAFADFWLPSWLLIASSKTSEILVGSQGKFQTVGEPVGRIHLSRSMGRRLSGPRDSGGSYQSYLPLIWPHFFCHRKGKPCI